MLGQCVRVYETGAFMFTKLVRRHPSLRVGYIKVKGVRSKKRPTKIMVNPIKK